MLDGDILHLIILAYAEIEYPSELGRAKQYVGSKFPATTARVQDVWVGERAVAAMNRIDWE
jgi:hypothetical protein